MPHANDGEGHSVADAVAFREGLLSRAGLIDATWAPQAFSGRGIVVVAGGAQIFTNAYVLCSLLRRTLGSSLPIELWHFGKGEISASMAAAIAPLDVRLVDAGRLIDGAGLAIHDGWQLKSLAVLFSPFAEVLLLDADQVPVSDPSSVFDWPQYRESGAVFWPDIVRLGAHNPAWELFGLTPAETASLESGQLLVDKRRHRKPLALAVAMNEQADRLYQLIYGDKDTFLFAWLLSGASYALVPHQPYTDERCLFQRDFDGRPFFQHRTLAKWSYSGEQFRVAGFVHHEACLQAIAELREHWNGRVFTAPARSLEARRIEERLCRDKGLVLQIPGEDSARLELRPFGEFGDGRAPDRQNWFVADEAAEAILSFWGGESVTYSFRETSPGVWQGRRHRLPDVEAILLAHGDAASPSFGSAGLVDQFLEASGFWRDGETDAGLLPALCLLARLEEGVTERLELLAAERLPGNPIQAARLREAAARLRELVPRIEPVQRDISTLGRGYVRVHGSPF